MKTGIYFGHCHNNKANIDAKVALMIESIAGNTVFGTLGIYGELIGGSSFRGQLFGDKLEFQTIDPKESLTIVWTGQISGDAIKGEYTATFDKLLYRIIGWGSQPGVWACNMAQSASDSILSAADSSVVHLRSSTVTEGPLAFPYFVELMLQGRWTRDVEFQIDGREEWVPIGMLQDAFLDAMPQQAQEQSMMRGIGSEATKKVVGGIVATVVLSILGIDVD